MFTLALAQMHVEGARKIRNLERARAHVERAASADADLVLLPETLDLGWTHPSARREAEPIPEGMPFRQLAAAARSNSLFVCAGLTEWDAGRVYNTAVLIDPEGELLIKHRKLNELAIAHDLYAQGDRLNACRTDLGTIGLHICADGFARQQVLSRALCYMGADVILSPGAWAVPADHDNDETPYGDEWRDCYKPVAHDFSVWIAGVSSVGPLEAGPWKGRRCIGSSIVVDPTGEEVLTGPYGAEAEALLYLQVEPVPRPGRGNEWDERQHAPSHAK